MKKIFETLQSIKKVEPPDYLFDNILRIVEQRKKSTISIVWVRAAAAVLICMISIEVYLVRDSLVEQEKISLKSVLPNNNNMLYNE
jgi:hypothetical protein